MADGASIKLRTTFKLFWDNLNELLTANNRFALLIMFVKVVELIIHKIVEISCAVIFHNMFL